MLPVEEFRDAVIVAVWVDGTYPAVTGKVATFEPPAAATDVGVVSRVLLSDRETVVPPGGAALLRVTVQVLVTPEARLLGLHASEERATGATRERVAVLETPLSVAVMVAV